MARVTALPCCTRRRFGIGNERFCARVARETRSWRAGKVSQLFRVARAAAFWCRTRDVRARKTSSKRARKASQLSRVSRAAAVFVLDTSRLARETSSKSPACQQASCDSFVTSFFFFHSPVPLSVMLSPTQED